MVPMEEVAVYGKEGDLADEALSVSAAMARAKGALESFTVKLIGEVSEVNNKPGYKAVYFTVKDAQASLPCMMWLNRYNAAGVDMRIGMLVELTGRFTLYAPKGRMNFDVFSLSLAGEGNLRLQVANLAKKLQAEGLMDQALKKRIPRFPQKIGLVTSPRGAAVHDVLRTLRRRFPLAQVVVAGVPVEGDQAASGLINALRATCEAGAEVTLLVRGGGSFEDMMPFNDEALARAIAALPIPVVTGIGHEPDTSIADMVSDLRASTPTAAAEAVSPSNEVIEGLFSSRTASLQTAITRMIERRSMSLDRMATRPLFQDPNMLFALESQALDIADDRLRRAIPVNIARDEAKIERVSDRMVAQGSMLLQNYESMFSLRASRLHDLSPLAILSRGYAVTKSGAGAVLKDVDAVNTGDRVSVDLSNGRLSCLVEGKEHTAIIDWEDTNE